MVDEAALAAFRGQVAGRVIAPSDAEYDAARRVWNGMIDRRPALIVVAGGASDVAPTIAFARSTGLPLAIRGGGHNVAGNGTVEGGIVLDMGELTGVEVDPEARLVRVEAGVTLGILDRATEPFGLAVPIGVVSGTGVAGLTLGGGIGWMTRKYGLTLDNLVSAEVVLASGETVTASAEDRPDLLWGLRGGGGNFGVVTSFTFRAYPHDPDALAGSLVYQPERWREALRAWRAWAVESPDEATTLITFMVPPPDWELGDRPLMFLGFAWAGGDRTAGEAELSRLRAACEPDVALLDPVRWVDFQSAFDSSLPDGVRAWWRNSSFASLEDVVLDLIVDHAGAQRPGVAADLHHMGGAFGRVAEDATAFPGRDAGFWLNIYGFWSDPADDEDRVGWVRGFSDAVRPYALEAQYVNFLGTDDAVASRKAVSVYGADKVARLAEIKRRYDPENLFRINHNIAPVG